MRLRLSEVKNFREQDGRRAFEAVVLLRSRSVKTAKNSSEFLTLEFGDNSASIPAMCFEGGPSFALLKDAPVVLLDEATASLDPENETLIQRAVGTLCAGKTVIVIAHRLRTVANADKIVVLDSGRVAEEGNHKTLLAEDGLYARLWRLQQESSSWTVPADRGDAADVPTGR